MRIRKLRVLLGLVAWAAILGVVGPAFLAPDGAAREPAARVVDYVLSSARRVTVVLPPGVALEPGDPVFVDDPTDYLVRIGRVAAIERGPEEVAAKLRLHPEHGDLLGEGAHATAFTVPSTAAWVVGTLLPRGQREAIRDRTAAFLASEGKSIGDALWPQVRLALLDLVALYGEEIPAALARHSEEIRSLVDRHRDGVIREKLVPVLQEVVLASAKERFRPLIDEAGKELWDALPIWSLGVKAVWEKVPLTPEEQVKRRFEEYLKKDAAPILRKHAPAALKVAGDVLRDSIEDDRVRDALLEVAGEIAADPETGKLARGLLRDLVLENERLREVVARRWETGLGAAVAEAARRFEPIVSSAVNAIALTPDRSAINPRLARVLRARVMWKDSRWVLLTAGDGAPLPDGARIPGSVGRE